jgi:hypothetical protein
MEVLALHTGAIGCPAPKTVFVNSFSETEVWNYSSTVEHGV